MLKKYSGSKARIQAISKNFFLHFHASRIHPYSLKPSFTMGLGVINFSLFLILLFSGILLMIYYRPSVSEAYFSILDINHIVLGGRYLRNMHRWAAHGLVFMAILHMTRTFYMASYTRDRKMTWHLGVGLLLVTLFASFTGYLLPWDQLGFWAVTIASNIMGSTRELTDAIGITQYFDPGLLIKKLLLGGTDVDQNSLTRFYFLHIILLPLTYLLLIALHFWRIRKQGGLNLPDNADGFFTPKLSSKSMKNEGQNSIQLYTWPAGLWAELSVFICTLAVLTIFTFAINAPLMDMANTAIPENPAKAPWYFLGVQELVSFSAFGGGLLVPILVITALFLFPYTDTEQKNTGQWFTGRQGFQTTLRASAVAMITLIVLNIIVVNWGWISDWIPGFPGWLMIILNPGMICAMVFSVYALMIMKKTKSTRMGVIALYTCIFIGYVIYTIIGIWFRGKDWQFINQIF